MDEKVENEVVEETPAAQEEPKCLTSEEILLCDDLVVKRIELPEWGVGRFAFIKTLPAEERDEWEDRLAKKKDGSISMKNLRAKLVAVTLCDADGKLIFGPGDASSLGRKSSKAVSRIFDKATRMNGITDTDIEEMTKN